jgi:inorganic pyrophosphatase/exopolyphosphatase
VTTDRDKAMAKWLLTKVKLSKTYVKEMFEYKSNLSNPLDLLISELATFTIGKKQLGVTQIEIVRADEFITQKVAEIKQKLVNSRIHRQFDYIFLTCIDVETATNTFVAIDLDTENLLSKVLGVTFENGIAKRKGILMRKEIVPILKEHLLKKYALLF